MSSLDPAISDTPSNETLAEALASATDADQELAFEIIKALSGAEGPVCQREDSFKRQLRHRLEQAYIRRSE